jgi:hypothetical protein
VLSFLGGSFVQFFNQSGFAPGYRIGMRNAFVGFFIQNGDGFFDFGFGSVKVASGNQIFGSGNSGFGGTASGFVAVQSSFRRAHFFFGCVSSRQLFLLIRLFRII